MRTRTPKIGLDRYLSKNWTDYAFELSMKPGANSDHYEELKSFLANEISGQESLRKTANQLKRLWLTSDDGFDELRNSAKLLFSTNPSSNTTIFHYGLSLCVFPIFKLTCEKLGEVYKSGIPLRPGVVIDRISESILNPTSVPRVVTRVFQTLEDWDIISINKNVIKIVENQIMDLPFSSWMIMALFRAYNFYELPISDIVYHPVLQPFRYADIRETVRYSSEAFSIKTQLRGDVISYLK